MDATYNSGFAVVKEKCAQLYNTSSADEHLAALTFRRKHPVLASTTAESFEGVFSEKLATKNKNGACIQKQKGRKIGKVKNETPAKAKSDITGRPIEQRKNYDSHTSANLGSQNLSQQLSSTSVNLSSLPSMLTDSSPSNQSLSPLSKDTSKVSVNTDLKEAINSNNVMKGTTSAVSKSTVPSGFKSPDLPLDTTPQLVTINRHMRDGEFRLFLLDQEKYYCTASRQSATVVMTAYLSRFISLNLRDQVHLKDSKGKDEPTLTRDFPEVYKFLIDVMVKGYKESNTQLKSSDAHVALRTVWGRTKQMIRERKNAFEL
ncbi:hypothetical protein Bhyg_11926 [Pseudolycoriella hygida]|uniref:Uncharacterized protein n=1 Tax=Pseudolycoriella hygida TaxID=35572 RepID=A0A9Q0MWC3_9DIPT|nr:hypothetical protein Bhyg_11926 [Pseudolycoriella hygida]